LRRLEDFVSMTHPDFLKREQLMKEQPVESYAVRIRAVLMA
jgi:hypothetical protein